MCPNCSHIFCDDCEDTEPSCSHYLTCCECLTTSRAECWLDEAEKRPTTH